MSNSFLNVRRCSLSVTLRSSISFSFFSTSCDLLDIWLWTSSISSLRAEARSFMLSQRSSRSLLSCMFSSRFFSTCKRSLSAFALSSLIRSPSSEDNARDASAASCARSSSTSASSSPFRAFASAALLSMDSSMASLSSQRALSSRISSLLLSEPFVSATDGGGELESSSLRLSSWRRRTSPMRISDCSMLSRKDCCSASTSASLSPT
mmetsp:Transcript_35541/g.65293  ORF Transcript_35541/g.65293 Transcript_35541/m.65293 type:complete len:208 (-) Transcript_35541:24-647(-)